jgi:hypothetical protein
VVTGFHSTKGGIAVGALNIDALLGAHGCDGDQTIIGQTPIDRSNSPVTVFKRYVCHGKEFVIMKSGNEAERIFLLATDKQLVDHLGDWPQQVK